MYYINAYTRSDAEEFCKWLLSVKTPVSICVNGGVTYNFPDETLKLYWLSGFQALVDPKT